MSARRQPMLGILGGGQLARMLALAAAPLGVKTLVVDSSADACAGQLAPLVVAGWDDYAALEAFAAQVDVVTFDFENVPAETARWLAERVAVWPAPQALAVAQDRLTEKTLFRECGISTPEFRVVDSREGLDQALAALGVPAILKTRRFGYDGKGQYVIRTSSDVEPAWQKLGGRPLILEGYVPFDRELSLLAVRGRDGTIATYPLVENEHRDGILHRSIAPAGDTGEKLSERAAEYASRILGELDYVGVLAIEWFQDGPRLLVNEMAPRVHNSGHWTIEGATTSQFENHVRAVCGLPLGRCDCQGFSAMFNFIGSVPVVADVLKHPEAHLHDYGKTPRPGRKVGHVTLRANSAEELSEKLPGWEREFAR